MLANVDEARRLYQEARRHKTQATRERNLAIEKMEQVRAICEELGIGFEVVKGVDVSHGRYPDSDP